MGLGLGRPPEGPKDAIQAFALQRRRAALTVGVGIALGGALFWLGKAFDSWALLVLAFVLGVIPILKGAAALNTCPVCGGGTEIPPDESGSWNHCHSCGVRIR